MTGNPSRLLPEPEAISLLRAYGIPYPDHAVAGTAKEATEIADRLGYPVVLKVVSPDVVHKSDVGGVVVGLENARSVAKAYERVVASVHEHVPGANIQGMLVCRQSPARLEVIVGALNDAMFGLGGIFTEVLNDVTFRVTPLERRDAQQMIQEIRGWRLLEGVRDQPGHDIQALVDLLLSVSQMVMDRSEIEELDLNPVRLFDQGLMVLDARILKRGP